MEKLRRRKPYQRVSSNLQQITGNNNNQAGRDINHNNFFTKLLIKPRNVRVKAIRNYTFLYFTMAFGLGIFMFSVLLIIATFIDVSFLDNSFLTFTLFSVSALFGSLISIVSLEKILQKVKWGYVLYNNKTIIYGKKRYRFYTDIWDMELKETWSGKGKLRYFCITKETKKPFSRSIVVANYAQAKYIYDSFCSNTQ